MNNLEYLNQISQSNRPVKPTSANNMGLIIKIAIGGGVALVLIIIVGLIAGSGGTKSNDLLEQLYLRSTNLSSTVTTYNARLRSSPLRAISTSLTTVINSSSAQLSAYISGGAIAADSSSDDSEAAPLPSGSIAAEETALSEKLNTTLEEARMNGILDRIYANEIQLQVSLLVGLISQNIARTDDAALLQVLETYYANLSLVENDFINYANPGD